MTKRFDGKGKAVLLGQILIPAGLFAAVLLSQKLAGRLQVYGLAFVFLGGAALALMSFSLPEIGAAFRHAAGAPAGAAGLRTSRMFWEAAVRNFWMLGVVASLMGFIETLNFISEGPGGIAALAAGMASTLVSSVLGIILAVLCLVPAWKLGGALESRPPAAAPFEPAELGAERKAFWRPETVVGYVLLLVLTAGMAFGPTLARHSFLLSPWTWLFYWPAVLLILGGTMAFALFAGKASAGVPWTVSFALTALIGTLMGFIQVLLGFAAENIQGVASAMTLILSSCFIGLAGMLFVGIPLEDRRIKNGPADRPPALSRAAWAVFPLTALIFLVITFFLVITPIRRH